MLPSVYGGFDVRTHNLHRFQGGTSGDPVLSTIHLAAVASVLPIPAHMFPVHLSGDRKVRDMARRLAGNAPYLPLQSVISLWLRSGSGVLGAKSLADSRCPGFSGKATQVECPRAGRPKAARFQWQGSTISLKERSLKERFLGERSTNHSSINSSIKSYFLTKGV